MYVEKTNILSFYFLASEQEKTLLKNSAIIKYPRLTIRQKATE